MEFEMKSKVYVKVDDQDRIIRCEGGYTTPADLTGWMKIDEGTGDRYNLCQSNYFPDGLYTIDTIPRYKWDGSEVILRTEEEIEADRMVLLLPQTRANKETELSTTCNKIIMAGMDVETSKGLEHFSLQGTDQINLTTATNAIQQGFTEYPYHADGELCRMFTAEEILSIADAATKHKLYHTTLCNHLLTWVRRAETKEELDGIIYSEEALPEDLKANMVLILSLSSL